nr:alkane 1-monooxygenase [Saprospiraceae bacterium]
MAAKYLLAYTGPLTMAVALAYQSYWSWFPLLFLFFILPLAEYFSPIQDDNLKEDKIAEWSDRKIFDYILYGNVFLIWGLLLWFASVLTHQSLLLWETIGLIVGMGIVLGSFGINVAHELGHRVDRFSQIMAGLLLLPALFLRFTIEHNHGHHKYVATDRDPASAQKGLNLYRFIARSFVGTYRGSFQIEARRLRRKGIPAIGLKNRILQYEGLQILYLLTMGWVFGWAIIPFLIAAALVAIVLLEAVNYIEHYGLRRKKLPSGKYEPVSADHSWNSSHLISRIFLYELSRHPDHHQRADKKYQILDHEAASPQMPYGYPHMI